MPNTPTTRAARLRALAEECERRQAAITGTLLARMQSVEAAKRTVDLKAVVQELAALVREPEPVEAVRCQHCGAPALVIRECGDCRRKLQGSSRPELVEDTPSERPVCRACEKGLPVMMLDADGTLTHISKREGVPSHGVDDAWWSCPRWKSATPPRKG